MWLVNWKEISIVGFINYSIRIFLTILNYYSTIKRCPDVATQMERTIYCWFYETLFHLSMSEDFE